MPCRGGHGEVLADGILMDDKEREPWDYDTGPLCQHWLEADGCDKICVCGHFCRDHQEGPCRKLLCFCEEFRGEKK